jgi:hypothetical protein
VCEYGLDEPTFSWDQDKVGGCDATCQVALFSPLFQETVYVTVPNVPKGLRGADMDVHITRDTLRAGIKGQPPAVEGQLRFKVSLDDSTWGLDTDDNKLESEWPVAVVAVVC